MFPSYKLWRIPTDGKSSKKSFGYVLCLCISGPVAFCVKRHFELALGNLTRHCETFRSYKQLITCTGYYNFRFVLQIVIRCKQFTDNHSLQTEYLYKINLCNDETKYSHSTTHSLNKCHFSFVTRDIAVNIYVVCIHITELLLNQ